MRGSKCHKPRDAGAGPGEPRRAPQALRRRDQAWRAHTSLRDADGTGREPHTSQPSKLHPAAQGGEAQAMIPGTSRRLGAVTVSGEGPFEAAAEIDASNTAKDRRHTEPIDTPKPTSGRCTAPRRDKIPLHQPEHRHKLPQPGKHRTLVQPHAQGQTPQSTRSMTLRTSFFLFFL